MLICAATNLCCIILFYQVDKDTNKQVLPVIDTVQTQITTIH